VPAYESCNLWQILQEVAEEQSAIAQAKQVVLEVPPTDPGIEIAGEPDRLARLFTNLISNAIAHTPSHGKVQVLMQVVADRTQIQVRDTGIGIPETVLPQIFERFYRYQPQRATKGTGTTSTGTGLGLAIAKAIIESHHGQINVESHIEQGTTFTISLPLIRPK
jgi:OmpR-family two-component system manganese-sensing sensor histidine kinase